MMVSTTVIARSSTLVFAADSGSRNIQIGRKLKKSHSVYENTESHLRERKQWFKIIEQGYSESNDENDAYHGQSKGKGKGGTSKNDSKGKGGGMMSKESKGKGSGKGSGLPKFCREFDFDEDHDEGYGKGKGKKQSKSKTSGKGKSYSMGKGKGSYEENGCKRTVLRKARRRPDLSIFVSLIEQAGLDEIFKCNGPFTVLAPSNTAFINNPTVTDFLLNATNDDELRDVLLYHILPGFGLVEDFRAGSVETLFDANIDVAIDPVVFNNDAMIVEGNITACNGVLHIINDILLPPGMFLKLIYTKAIPFDRLLTVRLHLVCMSYHCLGFVILPDICPLLDFRSSVNRRLQDDGALCEPNILSTAALNPDLSTFVALLDLAGLSDIFLCAGPFTCLAPTNDAFDALGPVVIEGLLDPDNVDILRDILLYHLVPDLFLSEDFEDGPLPTLFDGQTIDVSASMSLISFNDNSTLIDPDILACNGVIHVLDNVLVPGK